MNDDNVVKKTFIDIFIEIIKISKYPAIILTLYLIWPNDLHMKDFTSLVSEFKYTKAGDFEIKFITKEITEKFEKLKKSDNKQDKEKIMKELILDIDALNYYTNLNKESKATSGVILGQVKLQENDLQKLFGTNELKKNKIYTLKKPIDIFEYSTYFTYADPIKYHIQKNKEVKILELRKDKKQIYIVLKVYE